MGAAQLPGPAEDQFIEYTYPAPGLLRDPHDVDRFALLDHLLERLQQVHRSAPEPEDRDHRRPASLAGERLPDGRHHPAGHHSVRDARHRQRSGQRRPQLPSSSKKTASTRWASRSATSTWSPRSPRSSASTRSTPAARRCPRSRSIAFDASGMDELISWDELKKKQYYVIPCSDEIKEQPPGLQRVHARSEEQPADHPDRSPRVLLQRASRSTSPTTPSVRPCPLDREERLSRRAPLQRAHRGSIRCSACRTTRTGACTPRPTTSPGTARSRP